MDTSVAVFWVVGFQRLQHSQLDSRSVPIFLYRSNDFDCNELSSLAITGLNNFPESALSEKFLDLIYATVRA